MFDTNFVCNPYGDYKFKITGIKNSPIGIYNFPYKLNYFGEGERILIRFLERIINHQIIDLQSKYILINGNKIWVDSFLEDHLPLDIKEILGISETNTKSYRIIDVTEEDLFYIKLKHDNFLHESICDFDGKFIVERE